MTVFVLLGSHSKSSFIFLLSVMWLLLIIADQETEACFWHRHCKREAVCRGWRCWRFEQISSNWIKSVMPAFQSINNHVIEKRFLASTGITYKWIMLGAIAPDVTSLMTSRPTVSGKVPCKSDDTWRGWVELNVLSSADSYVIFYTRLSKSQCPNSDVLLYLSSNWWMDQSCVQERQKAPE